jgi:hypothetical protein
VKAPRGDKNPENIEKSFTDGLLGIEKFAYRQKQKIEKL